MERVKNLRIVGWLVVTLVFVLLYFCVSARVVYGSTDTIRVTGFHYPRNRFSLVSLTGKLPPYHHYSDILYGSVLNTNNFGPDGVVGCGVDLLPFMDNISEGSLVDESDNLLVDIFFGGYNDVELSSEEAEELARFIRAGGLAYVSGYGGQAVIGPEYNPLFVSLGVDDRISTEARFPGPYVQSSDPPDDTPITNGPFGAVGPLMHESFRVIDVVQMRGLALGFNTSDHILAEGQFGKGYLIVTGWPLYLNNIIGDSDNKNYFLNLFALACRDKPEKILNVPSYKQGLTPFDGNDPSWENDEYDHGARQTLWCGDSIGECGCALTSAAMVMKYFGVEDGINENLEKVPLDVGNLNKYFNFDTQKIDSIYKSLGYYGGNIRWTEPSIYSAVLDATVAPGQPKLDHPVRENFDETKLRNYLDNDIPVILKVNGPFGTHWVVVKGYIGDEFIINDPASPDPSFGEYTTLSSYSYTPATSLSMIHYVTTNSDYSYIEFIAKAPIQFLITDSVGNKTGFNSSTDEILSEIPGSYYVFDEPYGDPTGQSPPPPEDEGIYSVFIKNPDEGGYSVEIYSPDEGGGAFSIYSSDQEGNESFIDQEVSFDEDVEEFEIDYSLETGEVEIIDEVEVDIDIRPWSKKNRIYPKSRQLVLIAIFGSSEFNASKIDKSSLTFGKTGAEESKRFCLPRLRDINRDGSKDMLCWFWARKTGFEVSDTEGVLKGRTIGGVEFEGRDSVRIIIPHWQRR